MNNIEKRISNLPAKPKELAKFVWIGKKALKAEMVKLEAITGIEKGSEKWKKYLVKTQDDGELLLFAEAKLGSIYKTIPSEQGKRTDKLRSSEGTKLDKIEPRRKQRHYAEQLDDNRPIIAKVVGIAREEDIVPIRQQVLREIRLSQPKPEPKPLPEGKYSIIYADPPWQYDNSGLGGAASKHYATMSIEGRRIFWGF